MLPLWAQWVFGSGVITLLLGLTGGAITAWRNLHRRLDDFGSRFDRIERQLDIVRQSVDQLRVQANGHLSLTGSLVASLNRQQIIQASDMQTIILNYAQLAHIPTVPNNPISPEEHLRLSEYVERAKTRGGPFTPEEVEDYQTIVRKLEEEKPGDLDVKSLLALGALLLGIYLLSRRNQ